MIILAGSFLLQTITENKKVQRSTKKRIRNIVAWTAAILFFATLFIMHWVQNYWKFDRDFVAQTNRYEIIHRKLTNSNLQPLREQLDNVVFFPLGGAQHFFPTDTEKGVSAKKKVG